MGENGLLKTLHFETSKKADFYRIPKAKIGRSFETLIVG
jgi:hypothetical protein